MRADVREWLSPPDPSINYDTALEAHQEGTATWFTDGNTFADWKQSGSLLWIHGKRMILYTYCAFVYVNEPPVSKRALGKVSSGTPLHYHPILSGGTHVIRYRPALPSSIISNPPFPIQGQRISGTSFSILRIPESKMRIL